ncbi:MAG TPA: beta-L-arabinofuranosidase domain-containing protein [Acidobacteriaceae bacterium]|jgi:hypothetical protein
MENITRRDMMKLTAAGAAGLAHGLHAQHASTSANPLAPPALRTLPLGEIRPAGWLERQLRIQADGMGGHLDEFWPDVGPNSGWLGGTGESWERGPYFLDGLLPLAWLLNDDKLRAKAQRFIDWTLQNQQPNGMIGPASNDDWWPRMVMVKVLAQYYEATGDPRVLTVLTRYFHYQLMAMPSRPLRDWGQYRWQDEALIVEWLYDRTHDPKLLALFDLLQTQGYDWTAGFADFKHTAPTTPAALDSGAIGGNKPLGMQTHGVNNGQAIKVAPVQYRRNSSAAERGNFNHQLAMLDRFHGMPNGMFSCDEHLAGLDVSHGTELCTVVETLFSLEVALSTFGDAHIADRIEKIAFNALPGTFTDDMWAHQYDQQPNQIQCSLNSKPWTTNGVESNLYGLAPNFGCCTANFHQGWPKFTTHLWTRTPDDGLAATLYAPCNVHTIVRGEHVQIAVGTSYPFRDTVRIRVTPGRPLAFPVMLRIPSWTAGASITVNGKPLESAPAPGTFAKLQRTWAPNDLIELRFPMTPAVVRSYRNSVTLMRGPLVFALDPGESWVKLRERPPTADWQVFPQSTWNYALQVDEHTAAQLRVGESPVGATPFAAKEAPVRLHVPARKLDTWRSEDGVAGPIPDGVQRSDKPEEVITLIPYGAAKLRITAFPQFSQETRDSES